MSDMMRVFRGLAVSLVLALTPVSGSAQPHLQAAPGARDELPREIRISARDLAVIKDLDALHPQLKSAIETERVELDPSSLKARGVRFVPIYSSRVVIVILPVHEVVDRAYRVRTTAGVVHLELERFIGPICRVGGFQWLDASLIDYNYGTKEIVITSRYNNCQISDQATSHETILRTRHKWQHHAFLPVAFELSSAYDKSGTWYPLWSAEKMEWPILFPGKNFRSQASEP